MTIRIVCECHGVEHTIELPPEYVKARPWSHDLTPGLVNTLRKFANGVGTHGRNNLHLEHDLELTYTERANFTKLRFFALVAKVRDLNGKHLPGHWLLTRRGSRFLKGLEAVSRTVETQANKVIAHSAEKVFVHAFRNEYPWFQSNFTWEIADGDVFVPAPQGQLQLIR